MSPKPVPLYLHGLNLIDAPDGKDWLYCPACQSDSMQPVDVKVLPAGLDGVCCSVTNKGVHLGRFTSEDDGPKGAAITATFQCVNGHELILQFRCEGPSTRVSAAVTRIVERQPPIGGR